MPLFYTASTATTLSAAVNGWWVGYGNWQTAALSALACVNTSSTASIITLTGNTITQGCWPADLTQWGYAQIQAPAILSRKTRRRMREEQRRYDAEMARATAERRATEDAARTKAMGLLMSTLTRGQQRSLRESMYFDMNVNGRTYRIRLGTHGNVRLIEGGREVRSFCAQPDGVPIEDAMLAQKLMLEADEQAFLRVANAREIRLQTNP